MQCRHLSEEDEVGKGLRCAKFRSRGRKYPKFGWHNIEKRQVRAVFNLLSTGCIVAKTRPYSNHVKQHFDLLSCGFGDNRVLENLDAEV